MEVYLRLLADKAEEERRSYDIAGQLAAAAARLGPEVIDRWQMASMRRGT